MIGLSEAEGQVAVLRDAAKASTVRQWRYQLRQALREWERAVELLAWAEGDGCIELYGSVVPGMNVATDDGWVRVMRVMSNPPPSLHVTDEYDPRGTYLNYQGAASPVVVQL